MRHEKAPFCFELYDRMVDHYASLVSAPASSARPAPPSGCSRGSLCPGSHDVEAIAAAIDERTVIRNANKKQEHDQAQEQAHEHEQEQE
jgi:hypothetical protein